MQVEKEIPNTTVITTRRRAVIFLVPVCRVCVYIYVYIHIYIHIYIYIYIYIYIRA
jgi:hypothetical protein